MKISVIVPCFNEEENIDKFYSAITAVTDSFSEKADWEYIFVNDGSRDKTLEKLFFYSKRDERVKYISFSRNFGKESAMLAGLEYSSGDYVVLIDADLQDPPELIPEMYRMIQAEKIDRIATRRVDRKGEPVIRSFFAKMFYRLINKMSKVKIMDGARDYCMMTRRMVDSVLSMKERTRFTKGILEYPGFPTKWLEFHNNSRNGGGSKWSFLKLFIYAIEGIVSFSSFPLVLSSITGMIMCMIAFVFIIIIVIRRLVWGDEVIGWASLACIILFVAGLQQLSLGVIGSYISRVYIEVKDRPLYVVADTNIIKEQKNGSDRSQQ